MLFKAKTLDRGFLAVAVLASAVTPAAAQDITLAQLNRKQITFSVVYKVSGTNRLGRFDDAEAEWSGRLQIIGDTVSGASTRVVTYQGAAIGTLSSNLSGAIGKAEQGARGGNYVWLLQDNALIMLRTFAVGGMKLTITFNGDGCAVQAPFMHEVGAGNTRMHAVVGGKSELTSATFVSSSCDIGG